MVLVYVAIALFILLILGLAMQPKQGTTAANAPQDEENAVDQLPPPPTELPPPSQPVLPQKSSPPVEKIPKDYVDTLPVPLAPRPDPGPEIPETPETFDIDRHDLNDRVRLLLKSGRKIEAIKRVSMAMGWGLKETKAYIDNYPNVEPLPVSHSGPVREKIQQLLSAHRYMDAIELVRTRTGLSSFDAKDYLADSFDCQFPF